jgi:hypothetical protein
MVVALLTLLNIREQWSQNNLKSDLCFPDRSRIAQEILAYLAERPDARDTLEGIIQWWLLDRKIRYQVDAVKESLNELVAQGLIMEKRRGSHPTLYGINKRRKKTIIALCKQQQENRT